jgi:phosphoglycolate phosphatase
VTYRLVIFDFDGTLADTFPWFVGVLDEVADRFHLKRLAKGDIESLRQYDARQLLKAHQVPLWKVPIIARYVKKRMAADTERLSLFAGVDELLRELSDRKIRLALASSNSYDNIAAILGPERVALFDDYECGASLFGKAAKLRKIVNRSGLSPQEAICIGDEIRDIVAARDARIPFGAVSWGYTQAEALAAHRPDAIFHRVEEILEKIIEPRPLASSS